MLYIVDTDNILGAKLTQDINWTSLPAPDTTHLLPSHTTQENKYTSAVVQKINGDFGEGLKNIIDVNIYLEIYR